MKTLSVPSRIYMAKSAIVHCGFVFGQCTRRFAADYSVLWSNGRKHAMLDVILLALGLGLFGISIAYVYGCDRL